MEAKKEIKDLKYDFHIELADSPIVWECDSFEEVNEVFPDLEPLHHPGLRYEDIVAHLFMQCLGNDQDIPKLVKAGRQYANQAMKRVCKQCTWADASDGVYASTSSIFAGQIHLNSTRATQCKTCRVGRAIVFGNHFDYLLTGVPMELYERCERRMFIHQRRWRKFRKMFKKERFIKRKVIEVKREIQKEMREVKRTAVEVIPKKTMPNKDPNWFEPPVPKAMTEMDLSKEE